VYDDSISYYEFLCKVAKLVNDISKHNEEQDTAIANNAENIQKNADDIVAETRARDTAIANEESARIRGDYEIGVRLDNDEKNITDLHRQIRWVAKKFGALPYDKEHSYNVGDFCLFNDVGSSEDSTLIYGNIYRCKESTTGEFDSTKWEMINLLQFVERIWSETLVPFADKYDETHTWNVNDIVLYGGDEVYGNTGGMPIIYRCINQTTGAFNYNDWTPLRFSWILDKALEAESVANDLDYMKISIARNYFGYEEEETQYYSEGTYVWYGGLLYKALSDITVDSPSVLPPDQNSDWTIVTLASDVALLKSHSDFIDDNINRLDRTVFYGFNSIASNYQSYSGTPLFYPKDSYVWYSDILYKANADVTVDSASVLPPDQNSSWDTVKLTDEIGSGANDLDYMTSLFNIIAHTFNENDIYYSGNVVKRENANSEWVLYKCNDDGVTGSWDSTKWDEFYPSNIEISGMQLYDISVGNQQRSTQNMSDIRELDTFFNSCIPMFLDKSVDASYPTQNFPKFSLCRTTNSPAPYAHVYYCTSDTDNTSFDSNVWVEISNLWEWVKLITNDISRYSEVTTTNITATIEEA